MSEVRPLDINHSPYDFTYTQSVSAPYAASDLLEQTTVTIHASAEELKELTVCSFIKKVSTIAFPGMLFYLFLILLETLNLAFIGHKYDDEDMIQGIGVSNLYMNCTMFAIVQGLVSGVDTLCANAYAVKKYKLMGLYIHRARIIGYAFTLLIVIIHLFTVEEVFRLFKLNERVVAYSSKYIYVCLVYVFFDVQTTCNFRFLNVIRKTHVNFFILVIGGALHPLWNYIFIMCLDLGVLGAGISFTISRFIISFCSTVYIHVWNPLPESYFSINKTCFTGLWDYLKFSLGSAFLMCAEWWAFEIQAIIAISISEDDYTVHIIISQFSSLLYSLSVGFSLACTILIGEHIAKSPIKITKKITWYSLIFGLFCMIILLFIFFLFRLEMIQIFISKKSIVDLAIKCLPALYLYEIFNVCQTILCAILKGLGKQAMASILTFIQFYIIMTALSFIIGKVNNWGVVGMWIGISGGATCAFFFYIIMYLCLDLKQIQEETRKRLEHDQITALGFMEETLDVNNSIPNVDEKLLPDEKI